MKASQAGRVLVVGVALAMACMMGVGCAKETSARGAGVRGSAERVKGSFSARVPGALVEVLDPTSHALVARTHAREEGTFEIAVARGRYLVVWRDNGPAGGDGPGEHGDPYLDSVDHAVVTVSEGQFSVVELVQTTK